MDPGAQRVFVREQHLRLKLFEVANGIFEQILNISPCVYVNKLLMITSPKGLSVINILRKRPDAREAIQKMLESKTVFVIGDMIWLCENMCNPALKSIWQNTSPGSQRRRLATKDSVVKVVQTRRWRRARVKSHAKPI